MTDSDHCYQVIEYRYLKVYFESTVDWRMKITRLRCSPSFFKRPRYDSVLTQDANGGPVFMRLLFIFTYQVADQVLPLALVQLYTYVRPSQRDIDLGLIRLRLETTPRFIPARSIIRGALIAPTFNPPDNHYHLVDVVDTDMFLRTRALFPDRFLDWDSPLNDGDIEDASESDSDSDLGVDLNEADWDLGSEADSESSTSMDGSEY